MEKRLIYFDNAATVWPKPESVYKFMDQFYRTHGVNPGRSGYDLAIEAGSLLTNLRKRLTKFFGGDEDTPERLVFSYNVTDALNLAIPGLIGKGDHVITTNLEHNSVIRPVNHLVRDCGAEATYLPFNSAGFIEPDEIKRAIRPNTKAADCQSRLKRDRHRAAPPRNGAALSGARHNLPGGHGANRRRDPDQHERNEY